MDYCIHDKSMAHLLEKLDTAYSRMMEYGEDTPARQRASAEYDVRMAFMESIVNILSNPADHRKYYELVENSGKHSIIEKDMY